MHGHSSLRSSPRLPCWNPSSQPLTGQCVRESRTMATCFGFVSRDGRRCLRGKRWSTGNDCQVVAHAPNYHIKDQMPQVPVVSSGFRLTTFPCKTEFSLPDHLFSASHGREISLFIALSCSLNILARKPAKDWMDMGCLKYIIGLRTSQAADSF